MWCYKLALELRKVCPVHYQQLRPYLAVIIRFLKKKKNNFMTANEHCTTHKTVQNIVNIGIGFHLKNT